MATLNNTIPKRGSSEVGPLNYLDRTNKMVSDYVVGGSSFICSLVHSQWGYLKYSWNYLWWDFNLKMFYCRLVVFHANCFCYFCDTQKAFIRDILAFTTHTQTLVFFFLTHLIRAQKTKYQNELSLQMYFFLLLYIFISFFSFPFTSFHFLSFHTLYFLCFFSFFTSSFILFFSS